VAAAGRIDTGDWSDAGSPSSGAGTGLGAAGRDPRVVPTVRPQPCGNGHLVLDVDASIVVARREKRAGRTDLERRASVS